MSSIISVCALCSELDMYTHYSTTLAIALHGPLETMCHIPASHLSISLSSPHLPLNSITYLLPSFPHLTSCHHAESQIVSSFTCFILSLPNLLCLFDLATLLLPCGSHHHPHNKKNWMIMRAFFRRPRTNWRLRRRRPWSKRSNSKLMTLQSK